MNVAIICGNLGATPELEETRNGTKYARVSVATTHRIKQGEEWTDETTWHSVKLWASRAEFAARFLRKGDQVTVQGRIRNYSWETDTGEKKYGSEIVANEIKGPGKPKGKRRDDAPDPYSPHDPEYTPATGDGDIPF